MAEIDSHLGVAMSGLTADARTLVDHGRVEAQQHAFTYNEPVPVRAGARDGGAAGGEEEGKGHIKDKCFGACTGFVGMCMCL